LLAQRENRFKDTILKLDMDLARQQPSTTSMKMNFSKSKLIYIHPWDTGQINKIFNINVKNEALLKGRHQNLEKE
jgi:hypothetical protein